MSISRQLQPAPPLEPILGIAFLNFIFVFIVLLVFFSFFAVPSTFDIRVPSATDNTLEENHATIRITSENVLYLNDRVVTLNDLKKALRKFDGRGMVVYVRVDRRASSGRAADVLDLCKGAGIALVKMVAL